MIKTALFAAAAALATAATSAPVLAKDVVVRHGDLDLATPEGQRTMTKRIDRAAREACDYSSEGRIPSRSAVECFDKAQASARSTMAALVDDARLGG